MSNDDLCAVELETITACNRRCSYCPNSVFDRSLACNTRYMARELYQNIIDQMVDIPTIETFSPHFYGEPLLDARLPQLIAYAHAKLPHMSIELFTNGDLLTVDKYRELADAGVGRFVISEHGPGTPDIVEPIVAYREKYGDQGVAMDVRLFRRGADIANRGGVITRESVLHRSDACHHPTDVAVIDVEGNVLLCCNDYRASMVFGNLQTESLAAIRANPEYVRIREELRGGIFNMPICRECGIYFL